MHKTLALIAVALLAGCANQTQQLQALLNAGDPEPFCWLTREQGYVVQMGLPVPLMQRTPWLDLACGSVGQSAPTAPSKTPAPVTSN